MYHDKKSHGSQSKRGEKKRSYDMEENLSSSKHIRRDQERCDRHVGRCEKHPCQSPTRQQSQKLFQAEEDGNLIQLFDSPSKSPLQDRKTENHFAKAPTAPPSSHIFELGALDDRNIRTNNGHYLRPKQPTPTPDLSQLTEFLPPQLQLAHDLFGKIEDTDINAFPDFSRPDALMFPVKITQNAQITEIDENERGIQTENGEYHRSTRSASKQRILDNGSAAARPMKKILMENSLNVAGSSAIAKRSQKGSDNQYAVPNKYPRRVHIDNATATSAGSRSSAQTSLTTVINGTNRGDGTACVLVDPPCYEYAMSQETVPELPSSRRRNALEQDINVSCSLPASLVSRVIDCGFWLRAAPPFQEEPQVFVDIPEVKEDRTFKLIAVFVVAVIGACAIIFGVKEMRRGYIPGVLITFFGACLELVVFFVLLLDIITCCIKSSCCKKCCEETP